MKQRITYIDAAKGISILLVMMIHIGVPCPIRWLVLVKTPLFFFLSGYFFHFGEDMSTAFKKNVKRILVPFASFYVVSYAFYYVAKYAYPPIASMTGASGILDCFLQKQYFNGPLWFLPCLFFIAMLSNYISRCVQKRLIPIVVVAIGSTGYVLGVANIDLPLAIDTAMTALPFYWCGYLMHKKVRLEHLSRAMAFGIALVLAVGLIGYFALPFMQGHKSVSMSVNRYSMDAVSLYLTNIIGTLSILLLCFAFRTPKGNILSFIGKNTMGLLCLHHLVYRPIRIITPPQFGEAEPYTTLLFTLIVSIVLTKLLERYLPWILGK